MKTLRRMWIPVLLQAALALTACDDDDDEGTPDSGRDGGLDGGPDSGMDAGTDSAVVVRSGNPLTICDAGSQCTGANATCSAVLPIPGSPIPYPGGNACTATCSKAAECGDAGACPIGEALANPLFAAQVSAGFGDAGYCSRSCTNPGSGAGSVGAAGGCPPGYICNTMKLLALQRQQDAAIPDIAPLITPFCFPIPPGAGLTVRR